MDIISQRNDQRRLQVAAKITNSTPGRSDSIKRMQQATVINGTDSVAKLIKDELFLMIIDAARPEGEVHS